jgi:hypothetical protein
LKIFFCLSIAAFGIYQLAWSIRWQRREAAESPLVTFTRAIAALGWRTVIYPHFHWLAVLLIVLIVVGVPFYIARPIVGNQLPIVAVSSLLLYALSIAYVLERLWTFMSKPPHETEIETFSSVRFLDLAGLCDEVFLLWRRRPRGPKPIHHF